MLFGLFCLLASTGRKKLGEADAQFNGADRRATMDDALLAGLGWFARAVGLFYLVGGLFALRAWRMNAFLDDAIARISLEATDPAERTRGLAMLIASGLTALSGLLLIFLLKAAVAAFLLNAASQAAYLFWARKALPPEDESDALGRRRTTNAFITWLVMTGLVLLLFERGVLT